ncbi:hypothetical protein C8R45DRAFT_904010 [Mycena sanguinolenta]|nr:hypothetical protein C8R45DRAFT_904010 [Mycena sanguinolenta]
MKITRGTTEAIVLAKEGEAKPQADNISLSITAGSCLPGAKLSKMTQSLAYKGIKAMRVPVSRKATDENVKNIQAAIKNSFGFTPTPSGIWKRARSRDLSPNIRNFLWKSIHSAHRVGKYWAHIPECEDRVQCKHCGAEESLEHILLSCPSTGQKEVWKLAKSLWQKKYTDWPALSIGLLLGSGLAVFKDGAGKPNPAPARLYNILIAESMHLIWKLRCESIIGHDGTPPTVNEVHNRWVRAMNDRLQIDINLTDRKRFGKQYTVAPALVLETWNGTLLQNDELPDDWLKEPGVLVGITPMGSLRPPSPPSARQGRDR